MFADGLDDGIIGVYTAFGAPRVVYSVKKVLRLLVKQGMSYESAREHFDFNIGGAWVGEQTPIWVEDENW